jgi:phospholipase/carboxylesterase
MAAGGGLDALTYVRRPADGEPLGVLVLLHGRGADEHDLVPLLEALDPAHRVEGWLPRGPLALPPGGAHWYAVHRVGSPDPETFWPTFDTLTEWVDAVPEATGVPYGRIVLGGFSQGAVMASAVALAAGRPRPAGLLMLSGFLPRVEGLDLDLSAAAGLPVAIGHGTHDPVIDVTFGRDAVERLRDAGADVRSRESPMGHSIDPTWLPELQEWLVASRGTKAPG